MEREIGPTMRDPTGYIEEKDVMKILSATRPLRDYLIFRLMYYCGRRVTEVLLLEDKDILWGEKMILFTIIKKKKWVKKRIPVDEMTLKYLKEYCQDHKGKLFDVSRQYVFNKFRKVCYGIGIRKVGEKPPHPHHLRHSFCVHWVKRGGDIFKLNKVLCHNSIQTTMFYLQFSPKDVGEEYEKVMGHE